MRAHTHIHTISEVTCNLKLIFLLTTMMSDDTIHFSGFVGWINHECII